MDNPDFVKKTLSDYGVYLKKNFKKDIRYHMQEKSRRLLLTLRETVSSASMEAGTLTFYLKVHGRFQDMGAGSKSKNNKLENLMYPNAKKQAKGKGKKIISRWGRKKNPWYNRNVWGSLNRLIPALMTGYADFTIEKMKAPFKPLRHG